MPITTIDLLYRQTADDHRRRVRDAERRIRLEGGRPLRPGLRRTARLAARVASAVRPRRGDAGAGLGTAPSRCDPAITVRPGVEGLR